MIPARAKPVQRTTRGRRINYAHELRELFRRSDLIRYLTVSTLRSGHRELALGQLWWLLEPLITMAMFVFLVQGVFNRGGPNFAAFVFCAMLPYRWFTQAISQSQGVLSSIGGLMRDVAFPKVVYPIALTLSNLWNFVIGFGLLVVILLWHDIAPSWQWLWMFPLVLQFGVFTLGISMLVSSLTILFQDLKNIMGFVLQIVFYLSPALYTIDRIPERYRDLYMLNPFASIFPAWRAVLLNGQAPDLKAFAYVSLFSVGMLIVGYVVFVRLEKIFPKIV